MLIEKWQNSIKAKREKYLTSKPRPAKVENYDDDPVFKSYLTKLAALRKDGTTKIAILEDEIAAIKTNKQIEKKDKQRLIASINRKIAAAKKVEQANKPKVDKLVAEAIALSEARYEKEYKSVLASNEIKSFKIKHDGKLALIKAKEDHAKRMNKLKNSSFKNKQEKNLEFENEKNTYSAAKTAIMTDTNNQLATLKQENYAAYQAKYYYNWAVRNHVHSFKEKWGGRWQHFKANFDFTQWITKYALYFIIITIFIVLASIAAAKGHNFITGSSIITALQITAPKIFFALGAACLILLGGTDLSIGRLTGIGVSFTLMILSTTNYPDNNGVVWFQTGGMPGGARVILALLVSIGFCTAFSAFSGFFTAKFKIHPFITTLGTQLISYGLFQIFWSATSTFTPVPKVDDPLMHALRGALNWQLILYAIIAIAIVWFIWNKTKFGKNLYAVGGNAEAAKVSGISPFAITLLAFVMAGILYGFGGFTQAVQAGTGNFNFGYGTETDAIAACVIGGISFTGGVGKVSGAVVGCVVLGFLTYAFTWLGIDSNIQLVIKGLIIIAAVTLDCVKYLKRK